ncbi:MAG: hypothetical protein GX975_03435 [Clostridiales bacterium]|nr:hypothetical protein [Clostridiales bacterium]
MRKIISLILVLVLLVGLAACGRTGGNANNEPPVPPEKSETPQPEAPKAPEVPAVVEAIDMQLESNQNAQVTGRIKGLAADGTVLWEYVTETCDVGQNQAIQDVGVSTAGYIFLAGGSVYCLDPDTGELRWVNEDFGGDGASWDFDEDDNLFLTGAFQPWIFGVNPDGETIAHHDAMPEGLEEEGYYWANALIADSKGFVRIRYFGNNRVLVIDPFCGEVNYDYMYAEPLDAEFLAGEWTDNVDDPDVYMKIDENLQFEIRLYLDDGTSYYYEGRFELDTIYEEHGTGPDWLRSYLDYTDDPIIDTIGMGDFIVNYSSRGEGSDWICFVQISNGDSFLSVNLNLFEIILYRITEPLG